MADLLVALPDQIKYIIVDRYYNFCSAKLSRTHHNFYSTLSKVSYVVEMIQLAVVDMFQVGEFSNLRNAHCVWIDTHP